jgi:hypothetical protein
MIKAQAKRRASSTAKNGFSDLNSKWLKPAAKKREEEEEGVHA